MTITPAQITDLQVGDIVRYTGHPQANGATVEGPVYKHTDGSLRVGPGLIIKTVVGTPVADTNIVLACVSKAPRAIYVNSVRTEAVAGDVARPEIEGSQGIYFYVDGGARSYPGWYSDRGQRIERLAGMSLRLLVDGMTGQVVP